MTPLEIMKQAYASNYQGSISALIQQSMQPEIAVTEEQQRTGLLEGPPRTMVFPDVKGPMHTVGMDYPVDMDMYDRSGNLVRSYESIPPGTGAVDTTGANTVVEQPALYRLGGSSDLRKKLESYRCGSTLKRK
jgi:hypothetical protein